MSLKGKVAIVTGGSRGIGAEISQALAAKGANVVVNYASNVQAAKETVAKIKKIGLGDAIAVKADIRKLGEIPVLFEEATQKWGGVDILVNNAAVVEMAPIALVTEAHFDSMFQANVKGVFFTCQHATKVLRNKGRIINIGSAETKNSGPGMGVYMSTKAAVEVLTKTLARELADKLITVNTVSPGGVLTDMSRGAISRMVEQVVATTKVSADAAEAQIKQKFAERSVFHRMGETEDIAPVVSFLASEEARWVTGQNILVSGGSIMF